VSAAETGTKVKSPWRQVKWYAVDSRGTVRACLKDCERSEAKRIFKLLFGEKMHVRGQPDLSPSQKLAAEWFKPPLTPRRCSIMLGGVVLIDRERRKRRRAEVVGMRNRALAGGAA
jgi:hypothetical protein